MVLVTRSAYAHVQVWILGLFVNKALRYYDRVVLVNPSSSYSRSSQPPLWMLHGTVVKVQQSQNRRT